MKERFRWLLLIAALYMTGQNMYETGVRIGNVAILVLILFCFGVQVYGLKKKKREAAEKLAAERAARRNKRRGSSKKAAIRERQLEKKQERRAERKAAREAAEKEAGEEETTSPVEEIKKEAEGTEEKETR